MISLYSIESNCSGGAFKRADIVARNDGFVYNRRCDYEPGQYILRASIESTSGWDDYPYDTKVVVDEREDWVVDYECTCPAASRYEGMCKHTAGLALLFNRNPESFKGYDASLSVKSSFPLMEYLMRESSKLSVPPNQETAEGAIDLIVTLRSEKYNQWGINLQVSNGQATYVIKDLREFIARMKSGSYHAYGRKLGFVHTTSAFTPHSQALVRLIMGAEALNDSWYKRTIGSDEEKTSYRTFWMRPPTVIRFFEMYTKHTFEFEDYRHPERGAIKGTVSLEDPHFKMSLKDLGGGAWELIRDPRLNFTGYGSTLYAFGDGKFYRCDKKKFRKASGFLIDVYSRNDEPLTISATDMPAFCATVLPRLEGCCELDVPPEIRDMCPQPVNFQFFLDTGADGPECEPKAIYGDEVYDLLQPGNVPGKSLRDSTREGAVLEMLRRYLPAVNERGAMIAQTTDDIGRFLFEGVSDLQAFGEVFATDAFSGLTTRSNPSVRIGVSIQGNLLDLKVDAEGLSPDEIEGLLNSYKEKRRYHLLKTGVWMDMGIEEDHEDLRRLQKLVAELELSGSQLAGGSVSLNSCHAFLLNEELQDWEKDEAFMDFVESFNPDKRSTLPIPADLNATLRPYQVAGFDWMSQLVDMELGGILADEMGLGKTLQVITLLLAHKENLDEDGPALVICPASLVYNWLSEIKKFAPTLKASPLAGTKAQRLEALADTSTEVFIISYETARIDASDLSKRNFWIQILDEAQYIKNMRAKVTRSVKIINAQHRLACTGTPIENRLSELWSIFDFLMPGFLGSYARFHDLYDGPINAGDTESASRLSAKVGPFIMRRLKADVLTDLPEKMESIVAAEMNAEQQELYNAHVSRLAQSLKENTAEEFNKDKIAVLAEITKLRQLCCDQRLLFEDCKQKGSKVGVITELIASAQEAGKKVLVFSQFTTFMDLIAEAMDNMGCAYYTITGATPKTRRMALVEAFNEDETPVFLISLKAGGTGLNLTGASIVIHADPWWNAAAQNQATDRAHRIGQTENVQVYKIIAAGSIEEKILELQEAKSDLADSVLAGEGESLGSLSREDLLGLLSED